MKYLPLLLANLRRKKIRTGLTVGSFAVALFLFGVLAAIRAGFNQGIEVAGADRLVVIERGQITEVGHHDELLKRSGTYARLYKAQLDMTHGQARKDEGSTMRNQG